MNIYAMHPYMHLHMHICTCPVCLQAHTVTHVYIYLHIFLHTHTYIHICISVFISFEHTQYVSRYISHLQNSFPICHLEICQTNKEAYCASIHTEHIARVFWVLVPPSPSSPINHGLNNSRGNGNRSRGNQRCDSVPHAQKIKTTATLLKHVCIIVLPSSILKKERRIMLKNKVLASLNNYCQSFLPQF